MTKFALFAGATHYPCGGMEDLVGRYETIEEAKEALEASKNWCSHDWYQIVDLASFEVIEERLGL
jgi:hypothetical protein